MKEEYLPVTIKLDNGDSVEEYIGSVTISDKDKNGYYKSKFKDVTIGIGYYKVNIYRNDSIIIHSEPATSFEPGELIQLKIN